MHVQAKSSTNEHIILVHGLLDSAYNGVMQSATVLTDSRTHGLLPEMKIALILADMEHTVNIK